MEILEKKYVKIQCKKTDDNLCRGHHCSRARHRLARQDDAGPLAEHRSAVCGCDDDLSGATPEEVEQTVSKPLEQNLATVENLKSLQSISNANYSLVVLEFENDADMNTAIVNTMQGVDLVEGSWDEEISSPYIMKINPNMMPIAIAAVDKKGATTEEVSTFVEDELMNQLEGITGVASISTAD